MRVLGGLAIGAILLASACMETRRSLSEDCLKNDDCLSQVCSQLHCATAPPTVDVKSTTDGATGSTVVDAALSSRGDEAQADAEQTESPSPDVWMDGDSSVD